MKRQIRLMTALLTLGSVTQLLQGEEFTFNPPVDGEGDWSVSENWNPSTGPPGQNDTAIIPGGKWCRIDSQDAAAKVIKVNGTLTISRRTLSLYGDATVNSEVNGSLAFRAWLSQEGDPVLLIMNDLTIEGSGIIFGGRSPCVYIKGFIRGNDQPNDKKTLTVKSKNGTLVLRGGLDIEVELVINEVYVIALDLVCPDSTLTLTGNDKSGNGVWMAVNQTLVVDANVHGDGMWKLEHIDGQIDIIHPLSGLTGDVSITAGIFYVAEEFCTEGDLVWSGGSIIAESGAGPGASFAGTCTTP